MRSRRSLLLSCAAWCALAVVGVCCDSPHPHAQPNAPAPSAPSSPSPAPSAAPTPAAVAPKPATRATRAAPARDPAAQAAIDAQWRSARPLDGLYQRIAEDLNAGAPLVIASYYGMWWKHSDAPERNLNWGGLYGHATMLKKRTLRKHVRKHYTHYDWTLVFEDEAGRDPLRTLVFHQRIAPNARWRARGVAEPFDAYLVMQAFSDQEDAAVTMTRNLRQGRERVLDLDNGVRLDVGRAQVTGYFGHNFFYDYDDFAWDGLDRVTGRPARAKGVFAVGCSTGRVPGFGRLIGENVYAVLYSLNLMGSEGYSTLALTDGLTRHMTSRELTRHANATYRAFQKIPNPERRVGKPFASHDYKLYPKPSR